MRRVVFVVVALLAVLVPGRAVATAPPSGSGSAAAPTTTIDNSFLNTKRDLSQCLGQSIEPPDCGIAPTQIGDRGGVLQYVTFGVLILAVAFISWRVARSVKARDAALGSGIS